MEPRCCCAQSFCRKFVWHRECLWPEDLPDAAMLVLAANDDLVPSALVRAMLTKLNHPCEVRSRLLVPDHPCMQKRPCHMYPCCRRHASQDRHDELIPCSMTQQDFSYDVCTHRR